MESPFRYLRIWMGRAGLLPTTRFARLTCLILGIDLLLFALKRVFGLFGSSYGQSLNFWINLLGLIAFSLFLNLAYRWLKARMLWRLRNRLIVTYVFIGVIPAVLLVTISYYTLNVFAGQFANFVVTSELNAELRNLAVVNSAIAENLTSRLDSGGALTPEFLSSLRQRDTTNAPRHVCAWKEPKSAPICAGEAGVTLFALPILSATHLEAIVQDEGKLYLRAVLVRTVKGQIGRAHV